MSVSKGLDQLRDQLRKATRSKDISLLKKAIEDAEKICIPELGSDLRKAREALEKLGGDRGG